MRQCGWAARGCGGEGMSNMCECNLLQKLIAICQIFKRLLDLVRDKLQIFIGARRVVLAGYNLFHLSVEQHGAYFCAEALSAKKPFFANGCALGARFSFSA
jgi:hypothetical protein